MTRWLLVVVIVIVIVIVVGAFSDRDGVHRFRRARVIEQRSARTAATHPIADEDWQLKVARDFSRRVTGRDATRPYDS